ncbi:unnamed protein product [Brassica oleracea]
MITVLVTNQTTSKATVIGLLTATFRKQLKSLEAVISPELPLPIKTHLAVSQSSLKVNSFDEKSCDEVKILEAFFTLVSLAEEEYDDVGLLLNHQVTIPDGIAMASHFLLEPLSPPCSFEP